MRSIRKVSGFHLLVMAVFLLIVGLLFLRSALAEMAETDSQPVQTAEDAAYETPAVSGDPAIGRKLFTGEKAFVNGGPPCISCHNVGEGALGGGALGPNLMLPNPKYGVGPAPINPLIAAAWINSPGTPVMGPIFSRKNVTDEEVEHLKAFFSSIAERPQTEKAGIFVGAGAAGFVGILIFFGVVWSGRYRNRVGGTAHDAIWRNYGGKGGQR